VNAAKFRTAMFLPISVVASLTLVACASPPAGDSNEGAAGRSDSGQLSASELHRRCYGYIYGREGFEKDYARALEWCSRSAQNPGSISSITLLAELNYFGQGIPVNMIEAARLYRVAAEAGHTHAQYMIGTMYLRGDGVDKDRDEGMRWLELASRQGYEHATELLNRISASKQKSHP
jgi:TPR repeat protein